MSTQLDCKQAFAIPGEDSIVDVIRPETGRSWIYGEDLAAIRLRYPGAEIVNCAEFFAAKAGRQDVPVTWSETTQVKYWEMLEVLPPAAMGHGGFLVGEPWDHHATTGQPRFAAYAEKGGKYWKASRPITRKEFAALMLAPLVCAAEERQVSK